MFDDTDRKRFVRLLAGAVQRFAWRLLAWVLMSNHFHFLIETPEPTLSVGMQHLEWRYANLFNRDHDRSGHLFQSRFDARLVDSGRYLLEVVRYDVLNPVRAGLTRTAGDWIWSSHGATAGLAPTPYWLQAEHVLNIFDPNDRHHAQSLYRDFVDAGPSSRPRWKRLGPHKVLGSPEFITEARRLLEDEQRTECDSNPKVGPAPPDLFSLRKAVEECFAARVGPDTFQNREARLAFALLARNEAFCSLREIGEQIAVGEDGARKAARRALERMSCNPEFAGKVFSIAEQFRG